MNRADVRQLILDVAAGLPEVGPVAESLKWGQPSFAPVRPNVGSSVRVQGNDDGTTSLMFICSTDLVAQFHQAYGDSLDLRGTRELRLRESDDLDAVRHCVAMALTYKLRKRRAGMG